MTTCQGFVVYAFFRNNGVPYYIGKGTSQRPYRCSKTHRSVHCPRTADGRIDKGRIKLLFTDMKEGDALDTEICLISLLGRIDKDPVHGVLRNMTDGGDGTSGRKVSEGQRRKMSENRRGGKMSKESSIKKSIALSDSGNPRYTPCNWFHAVCGIVESRSASELVKMYPEQRLNHSHLRKVARGEECSCKGWRNLDNPLFYIQGEKHKKRVDWVHEGYGIVRNKSASEMVKLFPKLDLKRTSLSAVICGRTLQNKGWRILQPPV
jgi:hypothetical protein